MLQRLVALAAVEVRQVRKRFGAIQTLQDVSLVLQPGEVLLVHGAGGHHLFWPPQIRRMHNQRIFAVDLSGHGKSEGIGHHTIEAYTAELIELIRTIGLNSLSASYQLQNTVGSCEITALLCEASPGKTL